MKRNVTDFALYRYRYILGYIVLLIAISGLLLLAGLYVPGGIRAQEIDSITASSALSFTHFDPSTVVNLPFHLLQRASLSLLGVSILSIKLASIVLGVAAIMGLYLLIREWFRSNIAVIVTMLTVTMPVFLFMAQDGTPAIYGVAVSTWLLYAATLVSRRRTPTIAWKIILFVLIALNLYTPLGLYVGIAVATTMIFHPHVRHTIKQFKSTKLITATAAFIILLIPLLFSLITNPKIGLNLLGIPAKLPNLMQNGIEVAESLFNFMGGSTAGVMHPMISLGVAVIIIIGIYRFFLVKYTARSYIIWFWAFMLLPLIVLNPSYVTTLFPLVVIMVAMGISSIISTWYRTFPKNPYARIVGLIPLSVIVIGISISGVNRYALSYTYDPDLRQNFSQDISIFSDLKNSTKADKVTVIVSQPELKLYSLYEKYDDSISVSRTAPATIDAPVIVSSAANDTAMIPGTIKTIVTDTRKNDADRFYVYTPLEK